MWCYLDEFRPLKFERELWIIKNFILSVRTKWCERKEIVSQREYWIIFLFENQNMDSLKKLTWEERSNGSYGIIFFFEDT
jgi:hypothetical protein